MLTNWAGNVVFSAARNPRPATVAELQAVVAGAARARVLGTGHSFNRVADTVGDLVSLDALPRTIEVDAERGQVSIGGAVRYGDLGARLAAAGLALANTGSLPHISVAGSCATGTHGSGTQNPTLGAGVRSLSVVGAEGDLVTLDRDTVGDRFDGCVLSLGRLGVVVGMVLDVVPGFSIAQTVVEGVQDAAVADGLADILAAAYSVSIFTTWQPGRPHQVWVKERVDRPDGWSGDELWGGRAADVALNPVPGMPPENATAQLGEPGPWNERLPHFRMEFTPSSGAELQSEYLLPLALAGEAWTAIAGLRDLVHPVLQVSEVRAVAPDPMWLSLTGGAPSAAFHFTWISDAAAVAPAIAAVEAALAPFRARPHWGKVFTTPPETLADLYPRLPDFRRLVADLDPAGKFGNLTVDTWIGLDPA